MAYTTRELSTQTLPDFERIAVKQGGCWCMYYQRPKPVGRKLSLAEWKRINRRDKKTLVEQGRSRALLVYDAKDNFPLGGQAAHKACAG